MARTLTTVVLLVFCSICILHAQTHWSDLSVQGVAALNRGDIEGAKTKLEAALTAAAASGVSDADLLYPLKSMGYVHEYHRDWEQALEIHQRRVAISELQSGPEDPTLLEPLQSIARVAAAAGRMETGVEALERVVDICERHGPDRNQSLVRALQKLALIRSEAGDHEHALVLLRSAAEIDETTTDALQLALLLEHLAQLEMRHGDPEKGIAAAERSADIRSARGHEVDAAVTLATAAESAMTMSMFHIAERLALRSLALIGDENDDGGATLINTGILAKISWLEVGVVAPELRDLLNASRPEQELLKAEARLENHFRVVREQAPSAHLTLLRTARRLVIINALEKDSSGLVTWQVNYAEHALHEPTAAPIRKGYHQALSYLHELGDLDAALRVVDSWIKQAENDPTTMEDDVTAALKWRSKTLKKLRK